MNEEMDRPLGESQPAPEQPQAPRPAAPPPPLPPPPPPFGGGYATTLPRKGHPLLTCLVVCGVLFFLVFIGLLLATLAFSSTWQNRPVIVRGSNTVGLVRIEEEIMDGSRVLESIEYFTKSRDIRVVLIRIDSPGGAVGTSQEIFEAIKKLRDKHKRVIVSLGNVAASGGYYVACAGEEIYSNPGTLTGSIGVILGLVNAEELAKKVGIQYEPIKSGKFKDIGSMARPITDEERKLLQGVIGDTYNQFVEAILSQRKAQIEKAIKMPNADLPTSSSLGPNPTAEAFLRSIADGRIFTGRQAVAYGLVDKLGTEADALKRAGDLIGASKPELYEYKPRRSLREMLEGAQSAISGPLRKVRLEYRMP